MGSLWGSLIPILISHPHSPLFFKNDEYKVPPPLLCTYMLSTSVTGAFFVESLSFFVYRRHYCYNVYLLYTKIINL